MNPNSATVREIELSDQALCACCTIHVIAKGGPGGQHANKTATGVRLVHRVTGITAEANEHREGHANRITALQRLRLSIACEIRGGSDSQWLTPHVRRGRLACGPTAPSWPGVVACLLDALAINNGRLTDASHAVGISMTQLSKALTADPVVRRAADAIRYVQGLSRLRI